MSQDLATPLNWPHTHKFPCPAGFQMSTQDPNSMSGDPAHVVPSRISICCPSCRTSPGLHLEDSSLARRGAQPGAQSLVLASQILIPLPCRFPGWRSRLPSVEAQCRTWQSAWCSCRGRACSGGARPRRTSWRRWSRLRRWAGGQDCRRFCTGCWWGLLVAVADVRTLSWNGVSDPKLLRAQKLHQSKAGGWGYSALQHDISHLSRDCGAVF